MAMVRLPLNHPTNRVLEVSGKSVRAILASQYPGYRATVLDAATGSEWRIYATPCDCGRACKLLGRRVPRAGYRRHAWNCPKCHATGSIGLSASHYNLCALCGQISMKRRTT